MAKYGRSPDDLKIMPGVFPVVGRTESEAQEKFNALQSLIDPVVGLGLLANHSGGFDFSKFPLDGPVPDLPETDGGKSRRALLIALARRENSTVRQLYLRIAGARGHWQLVGTPEQIADQLEERFVNYGADGFLATAWSVSEDGLRYTFALRRGVKWHDGRDFTAAWSAPLRVDSLGSLI